jgi:hypothetical protein
VAGGGRHRRPGGHGALGPTATQRIAGETVEQGSAG